MTAGSPEEAALLDELVATAPELEPLRREHVDDNFGQTLPHLLLGDITACLSSWITGTAAEQAAARRGLDFVEERFESDPSMQEIIAVSFVENLPWDEQPGHEIRSELGPALSAEAERIG